MRNEVSKKGVELNWPSGKRSLNMQPAICCRRLDGPIDKARHLLLKFLRAREVLHPKEADFVNM